jgi:hypothetical protein
MSEDSAKMDAAAEEAAVKLRALANQLAVEVIAQWWEENFAKAGHKRLGRVLLATRKTKKGPDAAE